MSTPQAPKTWWAGAGAFLHCALIVVPCAFSDMVVTFRGKRKIVASWFLIANIVTTSKALVTRSDALVTTSVLVSKRNFVLWWSRADFS